MKKIFAILALPVVLFSCKEKENVNDCTDTLCTLDFRSVGINIKSSTSDTVHLDSYYTVNTNTNDTIFAGNSILGEYPRTYVVLSDGYLSKMRNQTYQFRFIGIINNAVVVDEPFTISADCCHISKVSGKGEVFID